MYSIPEGRGPTRGGKAKYKRQIDPVERQIPGDDTLDYETRWLVEVFFAHLWHNDHGSDENLQRAVNIVEALRRGSTIPKRRTIPRSA